MTQLFCPLCKQAVSKKLYDKITGIWSEKQKLEGQYKKKIVALKRQKTDLRDSFLQKEKNLKEKLRSRSLSEIKRKTRLLNNKIEKLNKEKGEISKKAEQKIHSAVHTIELRAKRTSEKQISKIKRELDKSAKAELNSKLKERKLKYQKEREQAIERTESLIRTTAEQQKKIENLENQLKKQSTPQVEGLLYEDKLLSALKEQFPNDKFQHTGKGGDIIHCIICKNKEAGIIVYECKRVLKFSKSHVTQTWNAKRHRNADFGILVTNATKKGYSGFGMEKGVIIIHPAGVLSLTKVLREELIQIAKLRINKEQRNEVIQGIVEYMQSAPFKNSLETIVQVVIDEHEDLKKEVKEHVNHWTKRREAYLNICEEAVAIKEKTLDALTGEKPKIKMPIKKFVLSLPEVREED